ncbi:hypothetical protein M409DRAFT_19416 [Zasmidium cellare ATCC 36951]|uniref:Rhodopsin domain-containing protein n=1 Tax=Zasmidium cellare ATCC 36951 TaxID=1080233 RepID=A0A6A6CXR8_ZASCE|nr:uncharacterized protein M409DRAFT_19416 [Zasmidium cellare ATCC 36951]KAF2170599.1 hypothetical protein M409DRAFT_19416 [Zasmidium cellare ATCC 36951]
MSATSTAGLFAVCGSFIGLSTISVGLRLYGRSRQSSFLGVDDWSALFGVVTYTAAAALAIELAVLKTVGYDTDHSLTPEQVAARAKPSVQISLAYDFMIMNTLACAKVSALFLYRRLFGLHGISLFNILIFATVGIIAAWYVAFDILSLLQCRSHFSAFCDGDFTKYCDLTPVWAKGLAWSDFLLDLWVLLMPIPSILALHTTIAKKLSIVGVFLLACVGLGASIARIVIFTTAKGPGRQTLYVGVLETGMSITVVNLPLLWFIFTSNSAKTVLEGLHRGLRLKDDGSRRSSGSDVDHESVNHTVEEVVQKPSIEGSIP